MRYSLLVLKLSKMLVAKMNESKKKHTQFVHTENGCQSRINLRIFNVLVVTGWRQRSPNTKWSLWHSICLPSFVYFLFLILRLQTSFNVIFSCSALAQRRSNSQLVLKRVILHCSDKAWEWILKHTHIHKRPNQSKNDWSIFVQYQKWNERWFAFLLLLSPHWCMWDIIFGPFIREELYQYLCCHIEDISSAEISPSLQSEYRTSLQPDRVVEVNQTIRLNPVDLCNTIPFVVCACRDHGLWAPYHVRRHNSWTMILMKWIAERTAQHTQQRAYRGHVITVWTSHLDGYIIFVCHLNTFRMRLLYSLAHIYIYIYAEHS